MFRNKTNIVPVAFLLSIIVTFGWLEAAQLLPYYATDPNSSYPYGIDNAPNSLDPRTGWSNPVDDGNGPQVGPIQPGQVVWLAFNNRPDPTRKKYVKIELRAVSGSVGRVNIAHGTGFADANTSGAINGTPTGNADHSATLLRKQYKFKKQPRWERFKVINKSNNPVTFTVNAWSICGNYTGDWNMLLVERGSFGAEDAMVSYDPAVEVQCFAESAALDPYAASVLVSHAPGSGPWSSEVLFVDPDGEPRPQGGVRFTTSGTGLMPGELFDLAMWMDLAPDEEKDIRYFIYTLDSVGFWDKYEIDLTDEECDGEVFDGDVDRNCRVNFMDVALLGANWLRCNDPNDPLCVAPDADGDGWDSGSDCDDGNPLVHPDRPEICGNELDDNCDDLVDSEDPACWECTNGQTRLCEKQEGVCSGSEEICIDNMWSGCDYAAYSADYEPTEITCDGLDNDCDGVPDDGNPGGGAACDGPDSDLCMEGIEECIGGFLVCSDNTSSNLDICDGLDNDCDASSPDGSEDPLAATPCDGPDSDLCMEGMQECIGGFLVCSDHTGSELDLCDGMDNDCDPASPDGSEDPLTGEPCDGPDSDLCMEGTQQCTGGALICSDNTSSTLDVCDGYDNDCDPASPDGSEDPQTGEPCDGPDSDLCMEGMRECTGGEFSCSDHTSSTVDLCDGMDNDCDPASPDGSEDPQTGTACDGPDSDLCAEGIQQCVGGAFWCSDNTSSTLDLCDGMDNDCDPSSPDGSEEAWVGQPCDGSDSDMCMEGTYECIGAAQTCTDYTGDTVELCDYLDNDCDGAVDEDFPEKGMPCNVGLGECLRHGTTVCSPDMTGLVCSATPGDPHPEICDGLDNDCDGYIDNGITCECYEDKDCGCWGSPIPCEAFGDPAMCFSQTGCQWISPYGCVSEPGHFPCESYGRGMCELQEGCYLEHCHDGECGP